jgi:hypothetical protein
MPFNLCFFEPLRLPKYPYKNTLRLRRHPQRNVSQPEINKRQSTLNGHQIFRPSWRPMPIPPPYNTGQLGIYATRIINDPKAIFVKKNTIRMPIVLSKRNITTITHFEIEKILSQVLQLKNISPTPCRVLGNFEKPKTSSLDQNSLNPSHPKRS